MFCRSAQVQIGAKVKNYVKILRSLEGGTAGRGANVPLPAAREFAYENSSACRR